MNANIVSILSWSKPEKSAVVLLSINFILWILTRQRPFYVLPMMVLLWYGRQLWRHRIRGEVMIDPPDHEEWITLSTYDLQQVTKTLVLDIYNQWMALRENNHLLWTVGTCMGWMIVAKVGMEVDFLTILFILSNAAFVVFPALEFLPKIDNDNDGQHPTHFSQQTPTTSSASGRGNSPGTGGNRTTRGQSLPPRTPESPPGPRPVLIGTPPSVSASSPLYDFYEGIVTRSISAAAVSLMNSPAAGAVFNIGGTVTSTSTSLMSTLTSMSTPHQHQPRDRGDDAAAAAATAALLFGPETLSPAISQMPDIDVIDSDPEDEFLFDAKHFDKSSSSTSVSNSFEIIDDDMQL